MDSDFYCRGATEADKPEIEATTISAFGKERVHNFQRGMDYRFGLATFEDNRVIVAKTSKGDHIVGSCPIFRYPCHFGSEIMMSGGIWMFGIHDDYKRRGLGQKLLEDCNTYLLNQGFDINLLFTGSPSFYRHKGYELGQLKPRYTLSLTPDLFNLIENFLDPSHPIKFLPFQQSDIEEIASIYESFNRLYVLTRVRDSAYWTHCYQYQAAHFERQIFTLRHAGKIIGYVWAHFGKAGISIVEYAIEPQLPQELRENFEYQIIGHIAGISKNQNHAKIEVTLFPSFSLCEKMISLGAEDFTQQMSSMMVAILNLDSFLNKLLHYQKEYVVPNINPQFLEKNSGIEIGLIIDGRILAYSIKYSEVLCEIDPKVAPKYCLSLERRFLGILVLGNMLFSEAVESEYFACDPQYLAFLDAIFPRLNTLVYPLDGF